ncbi:DUF6503 family protein [Tunicatimonas pelagia]|uniref:DUF6503 family protein n=1 Tax=Tunicatimonas pelagia TaxID=931531 RepID=UPI0026650915|nr:DUF6503 family protein [Tunicatimonas pelagia]WKN44621.1 DUF6503 family protein [Tunicatimonas pelagia]
MKYTLTLVLSFVLNAAALSQDLTASELLERAIAYHDPDGQWVTFNDAFTVVMTRPNSPKRESRVAINLPEDYFSLEAERDTITTQYIIDQSDCQMLYQGELIDGTVAQSTDMSCERGAMYKNYYTYLYGLPMKLRDPGTNINHPVEQKEFQGKQYLVLKATYNADVGSDVWYFYFHPETYALQVYQFYKTNESGEMLPDSGEYILLSEEATVSGIKMPKVRAWYYNKDNQYLATDTLVD